MPDTKQPVVVRVTYDNDNGVRDAIQEAGIDLSWKDETLLFEYPTVYIIHKPETAIAQHSFTNAQVYVGETNDIESRTRQHRLADTGTIDTTWNNFRNPETVMYVVGHEHFNKSLTLDVENRFMSYVLASDTDASLGITNGRGNPQKNYYTRDELESIVRKAWRKLHTYDEDLFPPERVIQNSAVFKASPFHKLSAEQKQAEDEILHQLAYVKSASQKNKQLILVQGMAGTGKTVLLSHLFLEIIKQYSRQANPTESPNGSLLSGNDDPPIALIVNHNEQETVYNAIMKRLGIQKKDKQVVFQGTSFINRFSKSPELFRGQGGREHQLHPSEELDIVLVDEAHLLYTQGNQSYTGHRNQLWDIMERAKVVIAVYDPDQVLRKSQELPEDLAKILSDADQERESGPCDTYPRTTQSLFEMQVDVSSVVLKQQFRIDACDEIIDWIDNFATNGTIGKIPQDTKERNSDTSAPPYEIRVFDSPTEMYKAIREKAEDVNFGLSRLVATYDWKFVANKSPHGNEFEYWAVSLKKDTDGWKATDEVVRKSRLAECRTSLEYFAIPWNRQLDSIDDIRPLGVMHNRDASWAEKEHTINEAGSIYTIQGFDLNYVGVIIGPSVSYRDGKVVFLPDNSCNHQAINGSATPEENLQHELNVLLKRGVHGLYLFAADQELQKHLLEMAK